MQRCVGKGWQKSAEAIVSRAKRGRAEHDKQGGRLTFEDMMHQKYIQITFDSTAKGSPRKRWSKGRLVSSAQDPTGRKERLVEPVLAEGLIEAMVTGEIPDASLRKVEINKGAPGVDGMTVSELRPYLRAHWRELKQALLEGRYRPSPLRRVEIPKPDGGVRELGIPTAVDRFIQQMILQALQPLYEPTFSRSSYGFRPGRKAADALMSAREHVASGNGWVVDIDLEKFFDRVNHDILMGRLAKSIGDKRLLKLIRLYLQAGVMVEGVVIGREEGTPQGGPLSPLLANILLDELDKELERRGHRFCRYADDCNIYVKTERAGQRVMESVTEFLETKLKLRVNRTKSAVGKPNERKFLGLSIIGRGENARIGIAPKSQDRFKDKIRQITKRSRGVSLSRVIEELRELIMGWVSYYSIARTPSVYKDLDGWIRRRLRCYVYVQWKRPKARARKLIKLGVPKKLAWGIAQSSKGSWPIVQYPAVRQALGKRWMEKVGFCSLYQRYLALVAS